MPKSILILMLVLVSTASAAWAMQASDSPGSKPLPVGTPFPEIALSGDMAETQAKYLGLDPRPERFALTDLKAPVVILEIYSMYCPFCQEEAPVTMELYDLIARRGLSEKIKLLGVAAGNSQLEVEVFRNKYVIPFPLFPDPDFSIHKSCGQVGTPFFYVLTRRKEGAGGTAGYAVGLTQLGRMENAAAFLDAVVALTGAR